MHLTINRDHLTAGLTKVLSVVNSRATLPVLANVLLQAKDGELSLTTTNLDQGLTCKIKANVSKPGAITLPVKKLSAIIKALPVLDVELSLNGASKVSVRSGSAAYSVTGIGHDEFPQLPAIEATKRVTFGQDVLGRLLKSISFAQSKDDLRYIMNGIFFEFTEKGLTAVATDGRRLAVMEAKPTEAPEEKTSFILPAAAVSLLERSLGSAGSVSIDFCAAQAGFTIESTQETDGGTGDTYLLTKLIDGTFPNYRQVFPSSKGNTVEISREVFLSNLRRGALMASENTLSVKFAFDSNAIKLSSQSAEYGEGETSITICHDGPSTEVAFNPYYIADALKALTCDTVTFTYFVGDPTLGIIRGPDNFICIVMGMRQ